MIQIALLRHGHTAWNRAGRIQGRTDVPLDAAAVADLSARALPRAWHHAEVCSSPLARAVETAHLVCGCAPRTVEALIEMDWGDWEGQRGADLRAAGVTAYKDIAEWGWAFTPPGGESPADLRARLLPWLDSLDRDTVAVCHIGVMRVLLALATGWEFEGPAPFQIKRNRLYVLSWNDGFLSLAGTPLRLLENPP